MFIGNGQCLHFLLRSEVFSFKLFGIFVNNSNKTPRLHKAGGTLPEIAKKLNLMKISLIILVLFSSVCYSQNVYMEFSDFQKIENKEVWTYQFVDASYSYSRPTLPIVTTKEIFLELVNSLPKLRGKAKEYSDYWILGIKDFKAEIKSDLDNKIIDEFYKKIEKYRLDNNLPPFSKKTLGQQTIFISEKSEICKYLNCKTLKL
ncbi:hypothetical protein Q762_15005 [Flavobacterium cauense R2A-7]|nr:hypothetical protein Q762_15005 [Flavobacterium cauense R2A-7]